MKLLMYSQLITILRAMVPILGDVYDGFGYCGEVLYAFMYELVANINRYVLIDTGNVI